MIAGGGDGGRGGLALARSARQAAPRHREAPQDPAPSPRARCSARTPRAAATGASPIPAGTPALLDGARGAGRGEGPPDRAWRGGGGRHRRRGRYERLVPPCGCPRPGLRRGGRRPTSARAPRLGTGNQGDLARRRSTTVLERPPASAYTMRSRTAPRAGPTAGRRECASGDLLEPVLPGRTSPARSDLGGNRIARLPRRARLRFARGAAARRDHAPRGPVREAMTRT
jgi:hypothetical protein